MEAIWADLDNKFQALPKADTNKVEAHMNNGFKAWRAHGGWRGTAGHPNKTSTLIESLEVATLMDMAC